MLQEVKEIFGRLDKARKALSRVEVAQVDRQDVRETMRNVADSYSEKCRPALLNRGMSQNLLERVDHGMETLIRFTQRRTRTDKYRRCLKELRAALNVLDAESYNLRVNSGVAATTALSTRDQAIVEALAEKLPRAARSYEQALRDLAGADRTSWRGTAVEVREALREAIDRLAPDNEVKEKPWFRAERDTGEPSRRQKVRFICESHELSGSASRPVQTALRNVEDTVGGFVCSVYDECSASTHGDCTREDAASVKGYVEIALARLLAIHAS